MFAKFLTGQGGAGQVHKEITKEGEPIGIVSQHENVGFPMYFVATHISLSLRHVQQKLFCVFVVLVHVFVCLIIFV